MNLTGGEWWQVFGDKRCQNWDMTNPKCADYPGLYPWVVKTSGTPNVLVWERNPYYFKVDTKGQQLPYFDKLQSTQQENVEMVNMKVVTGEVDFLRESTAYLSGQSAGFNLYSSEVAGRCVILKATKEFPL